MGIEKGERKVPKYLFLLYCKFNKSGLVRLLIEDIINKQL